MIPQKTRDFDQSTGTSKGQWVAVGSRWLSLWNTVAPTMRSGVKMAVESGNVNSAPTGGGSRTELDQWLGGRDRGRRGRMTLSGHQAKGPGVEEA